MQDNCHFCTNEASCDTCSIGTYSSGGICYKCPDSCSQCSSATKCDKCAVGYGKSGNSCILKAANGCFQYQNTNNCNYAANGYYIQGNQIKICSDKRNNCLECSQDSSAKCYGC